MTVVGENIEAPLKQVNHADLPFLEWNKESLYARKCPTCENGSLLMRRDRANDLILQSVDICLFCGQTYEYLDIKDVRRKDWAQMGTAK